MAAVVTELFCNNEGLSYWISSRSYTHEHLSEHFLKVELLSQWVYAFKMLLDVAKLPSKTLFEYS